MYLDYLNACNHLCLDMSLNKNAYPHEFKKWHDIRIDEYNSKRATIDAVERKEFYGEFAKIAHKYLSLENYENSEFAVFIARSPAELIREGDFLHHCVGRMNYDQKFVREETLIFFIRSIISTQGIVISSKFIENSPMISFMTNGCRLQINN